MSPMLLQLLMSNPQLLTVLVQRLSGGMGFRPPGPGQDPHQPLLGSPQGPDFGLRRGNAGIPMPKGPLPGLRGQGGGNTGGPFGDLGGPFGFLGGDKGLMGNQGDSISGVRGRMQF